MAESKETNAEAMIAYIFNLEKKCSTEYNRGYKAGYLAAIKDYTEIVRVLKEPAAANTEVTV